MPSYHVSSDQLTQIKNAEIYMSQIIADNRELIQKVDSIYWQGSAATEFKIAFDNYIKIANYKNQHISNSLKILYDFVLEMLTKSQSRRNGSSIRSYSYGHNGYQNTYSNKNNITTINNNSYSNDVIRYGNLAGRQLHVPENNQMTNDLNELLKFKASARNNPNLQPKYLELQDRFISKYKKDMKEVSHAYWRGSEYYFVLKDQSGKSVKVKMTYNSGWSRSDWFYTGNSWGDVIKSNVISQVVPGKSHSRPTYHLEIVN